MLSQVDVDVHSLAWSPSGMKVAIGSGRGPQVGLLIVDAATGTIESEVRFINEVHCMAWSP